jgi:hypothetical protein
LGPDDDDDTGGGGSPTLDDADGDEDELIVSR